VRLSESVFAIVCACDERNVAENYKKAGSERTYNNMDRLAKLGLCAAVFAAIVAVFYRSNSNFDDVHLNKRLESVLTSLIKQEKTVKIPAGVSEAKGPRIAVGYGACNDLFVDVREMFGHEDAPDVPGHYNEIENEEQLKNMLAYFFQHGAAAE
jgi:ADP-dependent glucokinase